MSRNWLKSSDVQSAILTSLQCIYKPSLLLELPIGVVHKWRHPLKGKGKSAKRGRYSLSLFSKMGDKGEGGIKNFKKWLTSFMDGLMYLIPCCIIHSCCFVFCSNYVYSTGQYNLDFVVTHEFGTKIWKAKYDHTFLKNCPIVSIGQFLSTL